MALSLGDSHLSSRSGARNPEKLLFWALLALLVWIPVPLGSNRAWAWGVLEAISFLLIVAWLALWAFDLVRVPQPVKRAWPAWIVLGLWVALELIHIVPMPAAWVGALSPESARIHAFASEI